MDNINNPDLMRLMIGLIREAQLKLTNETLLLAENMPKTTEIKKLLDRLRICDEKIEKQCNFSVRVGDMVRKYAK